MKVWILIVVGIMMGAGGFCYYMGAFRSIAIRKETAGPFFLVYREMEGNSFSGVEQITNEIKSVLEEAGIHSVRPFDVFYPEGVGQPNEIGFCLSQTDYERHRERFTGRGVLQRVIPEQTYLITEFPYRNPLSFFFGYFKVNPALEKYRMRFGIKNRYAIARNDGSVISYLQPVAE